MPEEPRKTKKKGGEGETPKETLISIIISFAMVFIFTRYVVASYVIPTGSMAPTLLGQHMRFWSPETGLTWAVNPWDYVDTDTLRQPLSTQGASTRRPIVVEEPYTGQDLMRTNVPLRSGDRIFVQTYLYVIRDPERWEVAVFKYPGNPRENWIKRIVGLPGERVWLVDGDVFTQAVEADAASEEAWSIQRKPMEVQESLWLPLYDSAREPVSDMHDGRAWADRWQGAGFDAEGLGYTLSAPSGRLTWDAAARPITDWLSYNDTSLLRPRLNRYPIADLRMHATVAIEALEGFESLSATIEAQRHLFQARLVNDSEAGIIADLRMRTSAAGDEAYETLASATLPRSSLRGGFAHVELWRWDQRLALVMDGEPVVTAEFDWSPDERLRHAIGPGADRETDPRETGQYNPARAHWDVVSESAVRLTRVGLDRDLYYQPVQGASGRARGASIESVVALSGDEYFMLGDNSAASNDGRGWETVDPWVERALGPPTGVVPRELILGKAFFVFWPSFHWDLKPIPVPDFGRMRWIE